MAGAQERVLRRRIRSAQSIRKTTRAMELIASSRIPRAQGRISDARPYAERLEQLAADLAAAPGPHDNPLLREAEPGVPAAVVVIAGDRGLSGPYNTSVLRVAETTVDDLAGAPVEVSAIGRRAHGYLRFRGYDLTHTYAGMSDRPSYEDARRVAEPILAGLTAGELSRVDIVSMRYESAGVQRAERRAVLPLGPDLAARGRRFDYELEPERDELLALLVPALLTSRIFLALLEASASEYAARQRAMKAATDNADDLITTLRRVMNRARQESITTEIMDVVGGAEALRSGAAADESGLPEITFATGTDG